MLFMSDQISLDSQVTPKVFEQAVLSTLLCTSSMVLNQLHTTRRIWTSIVQMVIDIFSGLASIFFITASVHEDFA
jgi:hypothetical protein